MLRVLLPLILSVLSIQVCGEVSADQPTGLTLESAFQLAQDGAPIYLAAKYRTEAADAQRSVAKGQLLPQLSLFGDWSDNELKYEGPQAALYGNQNYPGERYGFQARQSLFNMSQFREMQRRGALFDRSESDLAQAEIELLAQVADAYLTVLVDDNTVSQFQVEAEALEKQLDEAQALYSRALIPLTQVLETETRSETVKADLIEAEGEAAIARERLTELIGIRDFALMDIAEGVMLTARMPSPEQAVAQALQNSPAVAAAKDSADAAEFLIKREKGSWWPEVSLVFNHQYSDVGFDNLTSPPRTTESVSIAVSYPLIQGGAGSARIRGAWAEFYAAKEELEGVKRQIETQTRSAWVRLIAANKRIIAAQQALDTASVNVSATQKSVKAGTARVTDVLFALAQRTRAQRDRFFAEQQRIMAWLELELITGSAPGAVAPVLSDALLSTAAVSATAAGK